MTQQEAYALNPGDKIVLINDLAILGQNGLREYAGKELTVKRVEPENDRVITNSLSGVLHCTIRPQDISHKVGASPNAKAVKPPRFSKANVAQYTTEGSNSRLQSELSKRINDARSALATAVKPEEYNKQMRIVREQLRQAKLIHKAIKQSPAQKQ